MNNLNIFDSHYLQKLLEPFAPGITPHIVPIKYEVLTPDCFLLLFRTTGQENDYHYFVALETDFESSIEGARCTVEDWHGNEVIEFWPLHSKRDQENSDDIMDFQTETNGPYFAMLAEVKPPTHKGYWAESTTIMPGDKIGDKLKSYSKKEQANIRKALSSVLQHTTDPNASFLESFQTIRKDTMVDDINRTDMAVSLYVQPDGSVELFYNYVRTAADNRGHKRSRSSGAAKQPKP